MQCHGMARVNLVVDLTEYGPGYSHYIFTQYLLVNYLWQAEISHNEGALCNLYGDCTHHCMQSTQDIR